MLTLKKINKAIQEKYPEIYLVRSTEKNYFYLHSDNQVLALKLAGLYTTSIFMHSINQANLERWIQFVDFVVEDRERIATERQPVFPTNNIRLEGLSKEEKIVFENAVSFENPTFIVSSDDDNYGVGSLLVIEQKDVRRLWRHLSGDLCIEFVDTERDNKIMEIPIYDFLLIDKH